MKTLTKKKRVQIVKRTLSSLLRRADKIQEVRVNWLDAFGNPFEARVMSIGLGFTVTTTPEIAEICIRIPKAAYDRKCNTRRKLT